MSYPNWVFTLFAFISFILCCIPFPWHFQAWNTGTCLLMAWVGLLNLLQGINSIIWYNNTINWAPVWCDITARFFIGANLAIPACGLCITRRLHHIASKRVAKTSKGEKRRQLMIDLAIGLGLPIIFMTLQYIPQGHRFNIAEEIGCRPATYNTWVAKVIVNVPPLVVGLISAVYAVLSIVAFNKVRRQNKQMFSEYPNLNASRYLRLMALAGADLVCSAPMNTYILYLNTADNTLDPWTSWENTHFDFSRVDQFPSISWRSNWLAEVNFELQRWAAVMTAIIFFLFFGFADEARKNYRSVISRVSKRIRPSVGRFGKSGSTPSFAEGSRSCVDPKPQITLALTVKTLQNSENGPPIGTSLVLKDAPCTVSAYKKIVSSFVDVLSGKKKRTSLDLLKPSVHFDGVIVLSDMGGNFADNIAAEISSLQTSDPSRTALSIQLSNDSLEWSVSRLPVAKDFQTDSYDTV